MIKLKLIKDEDQNRDDKRLIITVLNNYSYKGGLREMRIASKILDKLENNDYELSDEQAEFLINHLETFDRYSGIGAMRTIEFVKRQIEGDNNKENDKA